MYNLHIFFLAAVLIFVALIVRVAQILILVGVPLLLAALLILGFCHIFFGIPA